MIQEYFQRDSAAYRKLEQIVWPGGPVFPHCGGRDRIGSVTGKGARIALKFCCHCRKQFRATIGTLFEGSHIPVYKWFQAIFLRHCCISRINAHQLSLTIQVTYKTALCMVRRLDAVAAAGLSHEHIPNSMRAVRLRVGRRRAADAASSDEEEVPWLPPDRGSNTHSTFTEVAQGLRPVEDPGRFEAVLRKLLAQPDARMAQPLNPLPSLAEDKNCANRGFS